MTRYYRIEPEVAGGWGENTKAIIRKGFPREVIKLHYQFSGWLGDCLLESTPCYIISQEAAMALESIAASGYQLDDDFPLPLPTNSK